MSWRKVAFLLLLAAAVGAAAVVRQSGSSLVELEAARVLPIEAPFAVEPSGLCLRDGRLFAVSDDTDDTVFEVVLEQDVARFVPALKFAPPGAGDGPLDLEGIAAGPGGSFYLASERNARVLQVLPDGSSEWVIPSALEAGQEAGLFREKNGRVEGIALTSEGRFLLAAERQSRGLVTYGASEGFSAQAVNETRFSKRLSMFRLPDFTGLDSFGGKTWVLFRNAEVITTMERGADGWREGPTAWSYRSIVQDPEYAYRDARFGLAEGLAVDERFFYLVLDNNGDARKKDRSDERPLLLILKRS